MGNHNVSSDNKARNLRDNHFKINIKTEDDTAKLKNSFLEINTKNSSSDRGTKASLQEKSGPNNSSSNKSKTHVPNCNSDLTDLNSDLKNVKIPTHFEWKEPAAIVYLTGSFCNWTQWFLMNKKCQNKFEFNIDLPRQKWEYKFIVDNVWTFSKHHPTCRDGKGNINNYIDTTDDDVSKLVCGRNRENVSPADENNGHPSNKKISIKNSGTKRRNLSFSTNLPAREEFSEESGKIPDNYKKAFKLRTNETISEKQFSDVCYHNNYFFLGRTGTNYLGENISFSHLPVPLHINLNHLCTKPSETGMLRETKGIRITSSCQRVKHKFITFVYYRPNL